MAIPLTLLNRFTIPLIAAAFFYLNSQDGEVDLSKQAILFDKTMRLSDQVLSEANGELGEKPEEEYFDYIVIGGGAAGAVIAAGLVNSTHNQNTVLILEAGGDPNPVLDIPSAYNVFFETGVMDWNYTTVQQTRSCLYNFNGYCTWPRGKGLGGTGAVNVGIYNRCRPKDYDHWANFTGDESWSWGNLREIYNRLEDYHGAYENDENVDVTHGRDGNVYVGKVDYLPGLSVLEEALQEKDIPTGDLNGGEFNYGFSTVDYNIKDGMRWGSYRSHLENVLDRESLSIKRYATATRILFNGTRAIGVEYERHGKKGLQVFARKEVILSAGAMESPKLLMLSGIGPQEHLTYHNIPTLVDLPAVGKHFQDHPGIEVVGGDGIGILLNTTFGTSLNNSQFLIQYLANGTGPMNAYSKIPRLMKGYLSSHLNSDKDWPDLYIYVYQKFHNEPLPGGGGQQEEIYFDMELMRTSTEGSVKLASGDPSDKPLIDPNFYQDPSDVDRMIDGIQAMLDLFLNSTAYQRHGAKLFQPFERCSKDHEFLSRAYWNCHILQLTTPRSHSTSSCRMGPNSTVAVVDSKLRVFGTQSLRVVDASVIPFCPTGNPYMPIILVAQKALEFIISDDN